ncbi:sigma-54-dependent transcriptional regulator [Paraburkholderia saeva]|uniref:Transcriptional regulatory protein ZraR n=1 Tax=Paraburkholderia saeva TaxID=2777537 RepID=A0A9N8RZ58_9BURK|nr:sigma-54 dependent transcriptional regulator [Paraburkholderia saeva]CAG4916330.1 Transcriptional regulatory protein ZraR [Paraburkholderia saeva]
MDTICTSDVASRVALCVLPSGDERIVRFLEEAGWHVAYTTSVAEAEHILDCSEISVGLVEVPRDCTSQHLRALESCLERTHTTWIAAVWPGQTDDESLRRFILDYCFDFVTMPCVDERLTFALGHAHGLSSLRSRAAMPQQLTLGRHEMIGQCDAMLQLYRGIDKCAQNDAPVFIAGASGTGKELTARAIHERSTRAESEYVAINCAAVPPTLLQSELFGHERGAFTGAAQRKIGRIEAAHGGTLFLDEIGDMPIECQAVLLRFLQEGTIERLGGTGSIKVDVRVISATHVNLEAAVEAGRFRADLYHRLCVLKLSEPPLCERGEDVKLLASYALDMFRRDNSRKLRGFTSDAITAMCSYTWPGNVRELFNCVRRAVVMAEGRFITAADLGLPVDPENARRTLSEIRAEAERAAVQQALRRHGYNLSGAAEELGVSRATLYRLMNAVGLRPEPGQMRMLRASNASNLTDKAAEITDRKVAATQAA